jgi:hemerythrin-like domain-containing protein
MVRGYRPSALRLQEEMRMFIELYRRHMDLEDSQAYPCARHMLNAEAVCTMNQEMAHRRVKDVADEHDDERWV